MAEPRVDWRVAVVFVLSVGGAVWGGAFGAMCSAFAGDASPNEFAMNCFVMWGVLGGASLGALPGLIVGRMLGMKRLRWLLGAAVGTAAAAAFGVVLGETLNNVNSQAAVYGGATLMGAVLGSLPLVLDLVGRYGGE